MRQSGVSVRDEALRQPKVAKNLPEKDLDVLLSCDVTSARGEHDTLGEPIYKYYYGIKSSWSLGQTHNEVMRNLIPATIRQREWLQGAHGLLV